MESLVRHFYEIPGKVVMLHDGEYLFHEGDMARYFYIVRSGQIFITKAYSYAPAREISVSSIKYRHRKTHKKSMEPDTRSCTNLFRFVLIAS